MMVPVFKAPATYPRGFGVNGQMFGAKQQVLRKGTSD